MDYRKAYIRIITKAKKENRSKLDAYHELHHILPKSLFPLWANDERNLVLLTAREHFFCHQLLDKIYPNSRMFIALWRLANDGQNNYCVKTSREYEKLKLRYMEWDSLPYEQKYGEGTALSVKQKISESLKAAHENMPEKFKLERNKKISSKLKGNKNGFKGNLGKHFYTNGEKSILAFECPEGFWKSGNCCMHISNKKEKGLAIKNLEELAPCRVRSRTTHTREETNAILSLIQRKRVFALNFHTGEYKELKGIKFSWKELGFNSESGLSHTIKKYNSALKSDDFDFKLGPNPWFVSTIEFSKERILNIMRKKVNMTP